MGLSASVSPIIGLVESEQNRRERQASFRDIPSSFNLFSCAATLYPTPFFFREILIMGKSNSHQARNRTVEVG